MSGQLSTSLLQSISSDLAWKYRVVPFAIEENNSLALLVDEKINHQHHKAELNLLLDREISLEPRPAEEILNLLTKHYRKGDMSISDISDDNLNSKGFLDELLIEAVSLGCSDVHFEAYDDKSRVRFRIDGRLIERFNIDAEKYLALVNKIKIRAKLDISEKRLPQDGRFGVEMPNYTVDVRVSCIPTVHGEKVVLRLLNTDNIEYNLDKLNIDPITLKILRRSLIQPNGILSCFYAVNRMDFPAF